MKPATIAACLCLSALAPLALAQHAHHKPASPAKAGADVGPTYPYTLDTCPVSGEKLGGMGDPVVRVYDNREVRFCCSGCIEDFEHDPQKFWSQIDAGIVDQQLVHYPITTCIVTGEKLSDDTVNLVHNNRLVRLANAKAAETFRKDPARYLSALDAKIIEAQLPTYPMNTCPVSGEELGGMGDAVNVVVMNRLVRLCCNMCRSKLDADPAKYLADLDAAYTEAQGPTYAPTTCPVSGEKVDHEGEPVEIVAGNRLVRFCCEDCVAKFKEHPERYPARDGD